MLILIQSTRACIFQEKNALGGRITTAAPFLFNRKNDYNNMRILSDELYARVIKKLLQNEDVALFQSLVMAPKAEQTADDEIKTSEVKQWHTDELSQEQEQEQPV